jgi:hypothetical protein
MFGVEGRDRSNLDCAALLAQDNPDALVLAVLCDFGERDPQAVVNHIFSRLRRLTGDDSKAFRSYLDMLEILSDNRDLRPYIKEAEAMLTHVEIERLPSYDLGMERGMEKGLEKGLVVGERSGELAARREVARNLLDLLDDETIAERTGLSLQEVHRLRGEPDR